jgi:hypothetical protein
MIPAMAIEYGRNDNTDHDRDDRSVSTNKESVVTSVYLYLFLINNKYYEHCNSSSSGSSSIAGSRAAPSSSIMASVFIDR